MTFHYSKLMTCCTVLKEHRHVSPSGTRELDSTLALKRSPVEGKFVPRESGGDVKQWVDLHVLTLVNSLSGIAAGESPASRHTISSSYMPLSSSELTAQATRGYL